MINKIILGHALTELPKLPPELVNCCVCSPPYWGLRDYGIEPVIWDGDKDCEHDFDSIQRYNPTRGKRDGKGIYKDPKWKAKGSLKKEVKSNFCLKCNAWRGSLGLEPTFELYIKHLCDIFDEVKRALRKDGTCWVNLGDSYAGNMGKKSGWTDNKLGYGKQEAIDKGVCLTKKTKFEYTLPQKNLNLIPQRFVIEMVNRGWILRNVLIWWKPNCMPSSAKDRFTIDYEDVFFFTKSNKALFWTNEKTLECVDKSPLGTKGIEGKDWEYNDKNKKKSLWSGHDYWFEQQFEEYQESSIERMKYPTITFGGGKDNPLGRFSKGIKKGGNPTMVKENPQGRNKRAVWTIPTKSFPEAHFAVYPEKLIEPMIKAGCPRYVCKKCGKARVKIYDSKKNYHYFRTDTGKFRNKALVDIKGKAALTSGKDYGKRYKESYVREYYFKGYTDCGCNAGWEGGIVLDPFIGAGTTALVALTQRKRFLGIEIKQSYIDMSYKRIARVQQKIF